MFLLPKESAMSLKGLAQQLDGESQVVRAVDLVEVEDSFDAPMMIMNQIHEA
jgi:hypothetical protein